MFTAFLIGVGVICAITTTLALLLVIADRYFSDYGECTLTINEDRTLKVNGGQNLLTTLKDRNIFIPSACGGRGSCGLCKVRIPNGGPPLATETPWLSKAEIAGHTRLACQVKVKTDLALLIPPELLEVRQYQTVVSAIRDLTYDIKEVRLKLEEPNAISFKAGQFVQFETPAYDLTDEPVYRAYSISSPPSEPGEIELEIRYVPNGICTTYVHRRLKVGDRVTVNGPYGDFLVRETGREMICVAGGSGMAPIKAILLHLAERGETRRIRYFFGARARKDLFLHDEIKALEAKLPHFNFIPALSDPAPGDNWTGETGRVTEVVARHVPDAAEAEAYLCGSSFMIEACVKVLLEKGMPRERIYFDNFG